MISQYNHAVLMGTLAQRPTASGVNPGTLFLATDTGGLSMLQILAGVKSWVPIGGASSFAYEYGDGSSGALVFDGVTPVAGTTLLGGNYTQVADLYATTAVVNAGVQLNTSGFRDFAQISWTVNGVMKNDGHAGAPGSSGGAGGNGAQSRNSAGNTGGTSLLGGGDGGAGGSAAAGGAAVALAVNFYPANALPGSGGNGGGDGTHLGGAGTTPVVAAANQGIHRFADWLPGNLVLNGYVIEWAGGAGGGGGAGVGGGTGGGGGGGGGSILIATPTFVINGTVSASGGPGGNGNAGGGSAGGGGGGSGGTIVILANSISGLGSLIAGGVGGGLGAGGAGLPGTAGGNGVVIQFTAVPV